MKIITWNRSFKGLHNGEDGNDEFDNDEWETLATVLDKMLAWEKKLFDEVKVIQLGQNLTVAVYVFSVLVHSLACELGVELE
jgi:Protein of unknown function (DUF632)